jgi:hypothetical protein
MLRQSLVKPKSIKLFLILQFIPLILFPPESFKTQEWWFAVVQLFRHSLALWPWYLISFAQGFNIISRLMMIMPHATRNDNGTQVFNTPYVVLTVVALLCSTFLLWYTELPEVRLGLVRE